MPVYFAQSPLGGPVKIGASKDVDARLRQLEAHYGCPLALLATMPGGRAEERAVHERFAGLRLGRTEQFRPAPALMEFIGRPLLVGANPDAVAAMGGGGPATNQARIELPVEEFDRLRKAARRRGLSVSAFLRQAVLLAVDKVEQGRD
jgi:hypothetical protein